MIKDSGARLSRSAEIAAEMRRRLGINEDDDHIEGGAHVNGNGKAAVLTYTDGIAEGVNERGVKVGGQWLNFSKYATALSPVMPGQHVRLGLDPQGFIREVSADGKSSSVHDDFAPVPDRLALRLQVLQIAADTVGRFAQCREQVKTSDVFPLADRMLAWVLEDAEA